MRNVTLNTMVLFVWVAVLGANIADAMTGGQPTWLLVFCPMIALIGEIFANYFE